MPPPQPAEAARGGEGSVSDEFPQDGYAAQARRASSGFPPERAMRGTSTRRFAASRQGARRAVRFRDNSRADTVASIIGPTSRRRTPRRSASDPSDGSKRGVRR